MIPALIAPGSSRGLKHAHLNMQPGSRGHIYQSIKTENVDFSTRQIRDTVLAKTLTPPRDGG